MLIRESKQEIYAVRFVTGGYLDIKNIVEGCSDEVVLLSHLKCSSLYVLFSAVVNALHE